VHLKYFKRLVICHISIHFRIHSTAVDTMAYPDVSGFAAMTEKGKYSSTAYCHLRRCTSSGLYSYTYVGMCVCMYVRTYVRTCVCVYVCMCVCCRSTIFKYRCRFRQPRMIFFVIFVSLPHRISRQFSSYWPRFPSS
jgi:hypothetical protein